MRRLLFLLFVLAAPACAHAESTLDRVRQEGVLRCAAVIRPGLAFPGADRTWHGLEVGLCRAVAVAVLGPEARIDVRGLYAPASFEALRRGEDGLAFLTRQEIDDNHLASAVRTVTPVFNEPEQVMVPGRDPARHVGDLSGKMACFEPGTRADRDVDALASSHGMRLFRGPFFEAEEMMDAFNVGRCDAIVGEATALAAFRLGVGEGKQPVRLLPEALSVQPVLAAIPADADEGWKTVVGSVLQAMAGGTAARDADTPGLVPGWQARVLSEVGTYDALFRRTVGDDSPLDLPPSMGVQAPGG